MARKPARADRNRPVLPPSSSAHVREHVKSLTRLIEDHARELSKLRNKRKSLILRDWMRDRRESPEFKAKMAQAMREAWADPAKAEKMQRIGRPRVLPPMTPEQNRTYRRFRYRYGVSRDIAVQEAIA